MGRAGSGPEFHVNSGSGRVGSLHLWVGLGRVKKTGPTSKSGRTRTVRCLSIRVQFINTAIWEYNITVK